jgi:hypothetical protein
MSRTPPIHSVVRHPSIRGIGLRYALGMVLPAAGVALVVWTVIQLFVAQTTPAPVRPVATAAPASAPARP